MKLSTTAILVGVLLLVQGPVSRPVTGQNLEDVLQAMVGLTTDPLLSADTPPANWQPVADRGLATGCLQNLDSGVVLCANNPGLPAPQLSQLHPQTPTSPEPGSKAP
ncbi:MAG TPA: hypothetical protein DCQ32_08440 [Cyanobacteria bacterium UBA8156]|nr:hypothetical protein [Cyanobacteria bacterium UBA8156]